MSKKIAIIVRDRKHEALRMAVGATLANDEITVFVMDQMLQSDNDTGVNLQMLSDLKVPIVSNNPENAFELKSSKEIAQLLAEYDVILPY